MQSPSFVSAMSEPAVLGAAVPDVQDNGHAHAFTMDDEYVLALLGNAGHLY